MSDVTRVPDICQSVCNQCVICDRISGARMCSKLNAKEIPRQCWSLFLWAPSAQLWCAPTSCTNVAMVLHIDLCWNTEISENALHITSCNSMSNSVQQCPTSAHSSHDFQLSQAPCNQPKSGKRAAIHLLNYRHHSQGCLNRSQKAVHIFVFPLHQSDSFVRFRCILSHLNLWEARSAGICRAFFMGAEKRTCWSLPKLKKQSLSQSDSIQPISRLLV